MRRYLVTGGAGFIGSNFIRWIFRTDPDAIVTNLDALTYAGVEDTAASLDPLGEHRFVKGDIRDPEMVAQVMRGQDIVVHFAAESHVDRSIEGPGVFISTNVDGTGVLLDAALRADVSRFIHVSTDEVYGSIAQGFATEEAPLLPSSPYSASKAGSDLLALSYHVTYGLAVTVTRCSNNYGPYQFPEKLIPLFTTNLIDGLSVPLYGDGANERDWLFVEDHCAALGVVIERGAAGEVYNIGAGDQLANKDLTRMLIDALDRDESSIRYVEDRPGHDRRYAVDSAKLRALGWAPAHDFRSGLAETVAWYRANEAWWRPLKERP